MPHTVALDKWTQSHNNSVSCYNSHFAGEAQKFLVTCLLLLIPKAEKCIYVYIHTFIIYEYICISMFPLHYNAIANLGCLIHCCIITSSYKTESHQ